MIVMMKRYLLTFMILSLTSLQVLAMNCGAHCSLQDTHNVQVEQNHDCCHSTKEKKEKKSNHDCMENVDGLCLHETVQSKISFDQNKVTNKLIFKLELPVISMIYIPGIHERYRPKIPIDQYTKFKANLDLYILKDQFLI